MINRKLYLLFIFVLSVSCTVESREFAEYIITNDLERSVELRFYRGGDLINDSPIVSIDGKGEIIRKSKTDFARVSPFHVFGTDSISIIFNNERAEQHILFDSLSILNQESYQGLGKGLYEYTITQENYDNAIPCDGTCN